MKITVQYIDTYSLESEQIHQEAYFNKCLCQFHIDIHNVMLPEIFKTPYNSKGQDKGY